MNNNNNNHYLEKKIKSLQEWALKLEADNSALQAIITTLTLEKKQWELEKVKQQEIFQQMLNQRNKVNNEILEETQRLREEIRKLKNGS